MKDIYLVALSTFVPFGPVRLKLLLTYFNDAKKVWNANAKVLLTLGLSEKIVTKFVEHRREFNLSKYVKRLEKAGITTISINDKKYPENLKGISDAPFLLYVKGNLTNSDRNAIAIVGSRQMSSYGKEVANNFGSELASSGITIVSGLARGIDTAAHKGALSVGGRTIAVLGCGLGTVYPPENTQLADKIISSGSAIISEYPLDYPALPNNFVSRNRIVSGLSKGVLVVEGRRKSGTLLTASHAADQGRDVFAIPGQISSPLSEAPNFLLQNGAKMVTSPRDILSELNIGFLGDTEEVQKVLPTGRDEQVLVDALEVEPLHIDEIVRITSIDTGVVSARLSMMEIKGLVKSMGTGIYKKI